MRRFIYDLDFVKRQESLKLFNVVSLFAGGGGSSTGYRLAGGNILAINEFIPAAQIAYARNYPSTYIFKEDIRKLTGDMIINKIGLNKGELDILDGSPPCSSFSTAGLREEGWGREKKYSDSAQRTDDLFFEFARILKDIQPKVFICENVKGITLGAANNLLGSSQIDIFEDAPDTIFKALSEAGYKVRFKVLNAKDFGVPQSRERTIFIGVRKDYDIPITYPINKTDYKYVTTEDAFRYLFQTEEEIKETNIEKYAIYAQSIILDKGEQSNKYFSLVKLDPSSVSPCLTATAGSIGAASVIHWDNRKLTVKEAIRVSSFPDDYYLGETYQQKIERLGRAVPPLMMRGVAEHVYNTILKKIKYDL
jgi:DNA (cytosine-5)-methyltransferase 1